MSQEFTEEIKDVLTSGYESVARSPIPVHVLNDDIATANDQAKEQDRFISNEEDRLRNVAEATWFNQGLSDQFSLESIAGSIGGANIIDPTRGVGRKWEAFSDTWDNTWLAKGINYLKYDAGAFREKDEEFMKSWSDDAVFEFLNEHDLGLEDFNDIKDAVSMEHAMDLAELKNIQDERQVKIQNALTTSETMLYSMTTSIADVDVVIGGAGMTAAKTLAKTEKVNRVIAGITAGTEVASGTFVGLVDDDTPLGEAMLFSTIIGGIDRSFIRSMSKGDIAKLTDSAMDAPKTNSIDAAFAKESTITNAGMDTTKVEARDLLNEVSKVNPNVSKIKRLKGTLGDFDTLIKNTKDVKEANRLKTLTGEIDRKLKLTDTPVFKSLKAHLDEVEKTTVKLETKLKKLTGDITDTTKMPQKKKATIESMKLELSRIAKNKQIIEQTHKDIMDIASDLEDNIITMRRDLDELKNSDVDIGSEMMGVYKTLRDTGHISEDSYIKVKEYFDNGMKGEYPRPKMAVVDKGAGKMMEVTLEGKRVKKLPYALGAALLAATPALGYDSDDLSKDAGLIVLAGILGVAGILNAKTIAKHIASVGSTTQVALARSKTVGTRAKIGEFMDKSRTSFTETSKPILENTTGDVNKLARDLLYNPLETTKTVETIKSRIYKSHWNNLQKEIHLEYVEWLKETGSTRLEGVASLFKGLSKRAEYNRMITANIEYGAHSGIKAVVNGAKKVNETLDSMMKEMREAGVKDIDETLILKNYFPRVVNKSGVQRTLANATASSIQEFVDEFSKMLYNSEDPLGVATLYVDVLKNPMLGSGRKALSSVEDIKALAKKYGFGDDVADELIQALGVGGDKFSRLKNRIPMDKRMFKGVSIDYLDGSPSYKMTIDDIFEHDAMNVMNDYLNKASGQVAFADMGYKSIDNAYEVLQKSSTAPKYAKILEDTISLLSGSPIIDFSDPANKIMRDVANYTVGGKMVYSTLALASEVLTTAGRLNKSGWSYILKRSVGRMRKELGDDSFMMEYLTGKQGLGRGIDQYSSSYGAYKTLDEFGNISGGEKSLTLASKIGEVYRDVTLHTLPFVRTSDFLSNWNTAISLQNLYEHAQGIRKFKPYEMKAYAITPRVEELLQRLEVNDKGQVKWFNLDKWSRSDRIDFYTTLDAMLNKRIQQSTLGTTGAWSWNSPIGTAAANLIKFPMSAFSNLGSFLGRGALDGDPQAMMQISLWFGGGALASIARHEVKQQEYNEEDIIIDAMLSHPFAGSYGTLLGVTSPAPMKTLSDTQEAVNIYNYK